jgi:hypothetical protein
MAPVDWISPRHSCNRWWPAGTSSNRLAQLASRGARLRLDRLRCRAYGGDHIRRVVWSRAIHKCARLATTMNVANRFYIIAVLSIAKRLERFERLERLEPFGSYVSLAT